MKVIYDPEVDSLSVLLSDAPVAESDQDKPDAILDDDVGGNVVRCFEAHGESHVRRVRSYAATAPSGAMILSSDF